MCNKQSTQCFRTVLIAVALFPLVSAFFPFSQIQIDVAGIHLSSEDILAISGALFLSIVYLIMPGNVSAVFRSQCVYLSCFFVICCFSALLTWDDTHLEALYLLVRMASYYYFANALVGIVIKLELDIRLLAGRIIRVFLALVLLIMAYNFIVYEVPFGNIRLQWPGVGAVIAGCTAAMGIGYLLFYESREDGRSFSAIGIILLLLLALCSQSRAGVYASFALAIYRFFPRHNAAYVVLCFLGLVTVVLAFDPVGIISQTRMGIFESARFDTWKSALQIFFEGNLFTQLFGYGFGAVFPYIEWSSAYASGEIVRGLTDGAWNQFVFHSHVMLVQPHNVLVYFLLEIGIVGSLFFLGYFCYLFFSVRNNASRISIHRFGLLLVTALLLNCFDSVFIINVASSFWWVLILLAFAELVVDRKRSAQ